MPTITPRAQAVISAFGSRPGVTQDHVNNLQAVITASPALINQINNAVAQGHLKQILPLTNPHAGGEYHGQHKEMHLPLAGLATPPAGKAFDAGEVTFVLGHELQHGVNHAATMQAYLDFMKDATQAARTDHDYTDEIDRLLAANRRDEAGAEIAGWNAVVSLVKTTKPNPTLGDIYSAQSGRMRDFIDQAGTYPHYTYTLKPNLTLNPDLTLSFTPANLEAMGNNFFDKAPVDSRLGHHGNSDYANHYGAWPVQQAAQLERQHNPKPQVRVDLSQLRLSEKLLEENGINLGTNQQPIPYLDTGTNPPKAGLFQHTAVSHVHTSPVSTLAWEAGSARSGATGVNPGAPSPTDPDHPNHAMLQQIREGVRRIDDGIGKPYDDASERMSRCLLAQCREAGLRRVDHVVMGVDGANVFAVEGQLSDPAHLRTRVATGQAIGTPVEQSDERLLAASHASARQQESAQQRELASVPDDPGRSSPAMQM
ncbi:XVIPCD domain-containing protein [Luteimonas mephitis]|uniref:XVIPCD domain-containing protein n=1 Tax=Luteimonas mephitis TaxID=83615 RepID=UPI003A9194A9